MTVLPCHIIEYAINSLTLLKHDNGIVIAGAKFWYQQCLQQEYVNAFLFEI